MSQYENRSPVLLEDDFLLSADDLAAIETPPAFQSLLPEELLWLMEKPAAE